MVCSVLSFSIQLQSFLQISVFQIRVDECPRSECAGASGCGNVLNVRDTPTVVDCGSMSLVSVTVESTAVCSCPGREQSHQPCSVYPRNPCFNGGVCVDTQHGYRWVEKKQNAIPRSEHERVAEFSRKPSLFLITSKATIYSSYSS